MLYEVITYQAYATYEDFMGLTEEMLSSLALSLFGRTTVTVQGETIEFAPPWERLTVAGAVARYGNVAEKRLSDPVFLREMARGLGLPAEENIPAGTLLASLYEEVAEQKIKGPTFVTEYPVEA